MDDRTTEDLFPEDTKKIEDGTDTNVGSESDELISRRAAIDAVKKNTFRLTFAEEQNCEGHVAWSANAVYSDVMEGALLELPSAQPEIKTDGDTISRQAAIDALRVAYWDDNIQSAKDDPCIVDAMTDWAIRQVKALPSVQPEIKTDGDTISEHDMADKLTRLINEFEMILSDIREKEVDDSVCGLCEYDADHGMDGYANECPGFEKDDCFKLKAEYRKQWMSMKC